MSWSLSYNILSNENVAPLSITPYFYSLQQQVFSLRIEQSELVDFKQEQNNIIIYSLSLTDSYSFTPLNQLS